MVFIGACDNAGAADGRLTGFRAQSQGYTRQKASVVLWTGPLRGV